MLGAEECFVNDMQAPVLLVNEIREVLARVVKLENAIESLTVSTHNAQAHQWDAIQSVKGEIQQLHKEQRDFQAVNIREHIFHNSDGRGALHVDMCVILQEQVSVVWDHPAIIGDEGP